MASTPVLTVVVMLIGALLQVSPSSAQRPTEKPPSAPVAAGRAQSSAEQKALPAWATPAELPYTQLWEIAWANEARFDVEFVGKRLQVSGQLFRVVGISAPPPPAGPREKTGAAAADARYLLWFQMPGTRQSAVGVACEFRGPQQLAHLNPSDAVEVVDTVSSYQKSDNIGDHVLLKNCTVIRPTKGKQP